MVLGLPLNRRLVYVITALLWLAPLASLACESRNELEVVFCQLKHEHTQLPSLEDFRRNSTEIQRLLLKRSARESGIELPSISSKKNETSPPAEIPLGRPKPDSSSMALGAQVLPPSMLDESTLNDQYCRLSHRDIVCDSEIYKLMGNQGNHKLTVGSLSAENRLSFLGLSQESNAHYWSDSYTRYIEKMLSIGLGASTMSYTKFVYTWQEAQRQGQNPEARFSKMFEYLKRDKQSLAVKANYDERLPDSISWCQSLSHSLWVCDNGQRNWVYQRFNRR